MVIFSFFRTFSVAGSGPIPIRLQSTPTTDRPLMVALIRSEFFSAKVLLDMSIADAPIEIGLDVAAVIVPSSKKAGPRLLIFSRSGVLGPSSLSTVHSPYMSMGTTSLSYFPLSQATKAFSCDSMANCSCSCLDMLPSSASVSAVSPIPM